MNKGILVVHGTCYLFETLLGKPDVILAFKVVGVIWNETSAKPLWCWNLQCK